MDLAGGGVSYLTGGKHIRFTGELVVFTGRTLFVLKHQG